MGRTFKDRTDWQYDNRGPKFKKNKNLNLRQFNGLSVTKDNEQLDDDKFVEFEDQEKPRFQR